MILHRIKIKNMLFHQKKINGIFEFFEALFFAMQQRFEKTLQRRSKDGRKDTIFSEIICKDGHGRTGGI